MRIHQSSALIDLFKIHFPKEKETPMIYYMSSKVLHAGMLELKRLVSENIPIKVIQRDLLNIRPFDNMILSWDSDQGEGIVFLSTPTAFIAYTSSSAGSSFKIVPRDEDSKNNGVILSAFASFDLPRTGLVMVEGVTNVMKGNKTRRKPQNYLLVVSDRERKENTYKVAGNKYSEPMYASQVCGHKRRFHKNPKTVGHDREGSVVIGWTWVTPHIRGDGKELYDKIRLFLK